MHTKIYRSDMACIKSEWKQCWRDGADVVASDTSMCQSRIN